MADGEDIRDEAERLVSAALAAASYALRGVGKDSPPAGRAERFRGGEPPEPTGPEPGGPEPAEPTGSQSAGRTGSQSAGSQSAGRTGSQSAGPAGGGGARRPGSGIPGWKHVEGFLGGRRIATGTPECCVCPVCRGIAAVRDPGPEFAFRVASGANDIASGIASILPAFQGAAPRPRPQPPRPRDPGPTRRAATDHPPAPADGDDPWHAATTAPVPPDEPPT